MSSCILMKWPSFILYCRSAVRYECACPPLCVDSRWCGRSAEDGATGSSDSLSTHSIHLCRTPTDESDRGRYDLGNIHFRRERISCCLYLLVDLPSLLESMLPCCREYPFPCLPAFRKTGYRSKLLPVFLRLLLGSPDILCTSPSFVVQPFVPAVPVLCSCRLCENIRFRTTGT